MFLFTRKRHWRTWNQPTSSRLYLLKVCVCIKFWSITKVPPPQKSGLFPLDFLFKMLYEFIIFTIRATCTTHIHFINSWCLFSTIYVTLYYAVLYNFLLLILIRTNIFLCNLISITLNLCSSRSVRDHVSHPYIKSSPITGLEWPRGFQEVKVPRFHDNGTGRW